MDKRVNSKERLEELIAQQISRQPDSLFSAVVKQKAMLTLFNISVENMYALIKDTPNVELWHARYVDKKDTRQIEHIFNYDRKYINAEVARVNGHIAYRLCAQAKEIVEE